MRPTNVGPTTENSQKREPMMWDPPMKFLGMVTGPDLLATAGSALKE